MSVVPKENATDDEHTDELNLQSPTQGICRVYNKKEYRQSSAVPYCGLEIDFSGLINVIVVQFGQDTLGSKGLGSAYSRDHFFGHTASCRNMLKREPSRRN